MNRDSDYLFNATANTANKFRTVERVDATLWYRPLQALSFGVQYAFARSDYFQNTESFPALLLLVVCQLSIRE